MKVKHINYILKFLTSLKDFTKDGLWMHTHINKEKY